MEQIKAMLEAMKDDAAFGEEMLALMKDGNAGEIIGVAEKKGFVFTKADWQAYIDWGNSMVAKSERKELSPEELNKISGGMGDVGCITSGCWFHAASEPESRNGVMRRKCNQLSCTYLVVICGCHGTDRCKDTWHLVPETEHQCG